MLLKVTVGYYRLLQVTKSYKYNKTKIPCVYIYQATRG